MRRDRSSRWLTLLAVLALLGCAIANAMHR